MSLGTDASSSTRRAGSVHARLTLKSFGAIFTFMLIFLYPKFASLKGLLHNYSDIGIVLQS